MVIPAIVIDELLGNYPKKLGEKILPFQKAKKDLDKLLSLDDIAIPPMKDAFDSYENWLDDLIDSHGIVVAPYPDVAAKELIEQSYKAKKPFKESGEGHKDYLVWKSIVAHMTGAGASPPNIFLSNNVKDFCDTGKDGGIVLHGDLSEQIEEGLKPVVYTSIKHAFEAELAPLLQGIDPNELPDLGPDDIDTKVAEFLLEDLPSRSVYGLEGIPFNDEVSISAVGAHSITSIALKRVDDEVVINVSGSVELEVDGFIEKWSYYGAESENQNMYVVDGNWNDHVMMVSATVETPFEMTLFYSMESGQIANREIALPEEIEDDWPYK